MFLDDAVAGGGSRTLSMVLKRENERNQIPDERLHVVCPPLGGDKLHRIVLPS